MTGLATQVAATPTLAHLVGRIAVVEVAVRSAVARRRSGDPEPDDPLRGVYLSDDYAQWLLSRDLAGEVAGESAVLREQLDARAREAESGGAEVRLPALTRRLGLTPLEEEVLVVALAPMLDRRFGQLYGYLNDDVTRRFATVATVSELARGLVSPDPRDWLLVAPHARLVRTGILEVGDDDLPLPVRSVRVAERVVGHLLGDDTVARELAGTVVDVEPLPLVDPSLAALAPASVVVEQCPGTDAETEVVTWLAHAGTHPLVLRPGAAADPAALTVPVVREALLAGRPVVVGPLEDAPGLDLAGLAAQIPVVVAWTRGRATGAALPTVALDVPPLEARRDAWRVLAPDARAEVLDAAACHRVGAARARRVVERAAGAPLDRAALAEGLRAVDGGMGAQGRRVRPRHGWDDLVLPAATTRTLHELVGMVRQRDVVVDEWGLGRAGGARGVAALFAGSSGTGKTLAAEVVARALGVDLFTVDLARVVDKYVGETEKNLDLVLTAAEGVTGIVFFDEADALFGRRGEVRSGQDRYANLAVSYLLQRVEASGGVVVLATNLRSQLDEAFVRRLDAVVDFPKPDAVARERIWRRHLALVPVDDVDVGFCARAFELSGGNIRNVVVAAGCLAAEEGRGVAMRDVVRGLDREHDKLGRLRAVSDYGDYAELLGEEARS